ncbi:hypothetical protein [Hyphomicrobium sp.]|uniref:hypothetical protein n=1 Tax=Hyphomicrobium sp. TaxID=82 RepID=UPI001E122464|nr:hypothetical protein [Hyphomicrobium sp.]MBY0561474.1 hypothetical protein [Hyphomicrobium sp.]
MIGNPVPFDPTPRFDLSRRGAAITAQALKKAVNDELFDDPEDEVEAVRLALMYRAIALRPG